MKEKIMESYDESPFTSGRGLNRGYWGTECYLLVSLNIPGGSTQVWWKPHIGGWYNTVSNSSSLNKKLLEERDRERLHLAGTLKSIRGDPFTKFPFFLPNRDRYPWTTHTWRNVLKRILECRWSTGSISKIKHLFFWSRVSQIDVTVSTMETDFSFRILVGKLKILFLETCHGVGPRSWHYTRSSTVTRVIQSHRRTLN